MKPGSLILIAVCCALSPAAQGAPLKFGTLGLTDYDSAVQPYGDRVSAYGGVAPYSFSASGFPAGLSCDSGGSISGAVAPAVTDGTYAITFTVTDAASASVIRTLPLRVIKTPVIYNSVMADGFLGIDYGTQIIQSAGGTEPVSWGVAAGLLPPGLALDGVLGKLQGTPSLLGDYSFSISYLTASGSATRNFTLRVKDAAVPPFWIRRGLAGGLMGPVFFSPNFALDRTVIGVREDRRGLFISSDGGYFWRPMTLRIRNYYPGGVKARDVVTMVAFSPAFDGRAGGADHHLAVSTRYSGVWFSSDLDATWTQLTAGLGPQGPAGTTYADFITFPPNYPATRRLYCISFSGTQKRLFSGILNPAVPAISWGVYSPAGIALENFYLSPDFASDNTLLASGGDATGDYYLYRSTNGGAALQEFIFLGPESALYPGDYFFSPNYAADRVIAFNLYGTFYFSTDAGANWTRRQISNFSAYGYKFPPDYHPVSNPVIYAIAVAGVGIGRQVVVSFDGGVTFTPTGTGGMPPVEMQGYELFISPDFAADGLILTPGIGNTGYFRSQDRGMTWGPADGGLFHQTITAAAYAPDFAVSRAAFIGTATGIYRTNDGGITWLRAQLPDFFSVYSLAVSPAFSADRMVFAVGSARSGSNMLLRSTDAGASFTQINQTLIFPYGAPSRQLQLSPDFAADARVFLVGTGAYQVSTDGGVNFGTSTFSLYYGMGVSPGFATDASVYINNSSGAGRWYINPDFVFNVLPGAPVGNQTPVFPSAYNRVSGVDGTLSHTFFWNCGKSTDGGAVFSSIPPPGSPGCNPLGGELYLSPAFAADSTLYSVVADPDGDDPAAGLYKSVNGGAGFSLRTVPGIPEAFEDVRQVAFSPAYAADQNLLVATSAGLYLSPDGGATWTLGTGTNPLTHDVTAVSQDPVQRGGLFVGTQQGRVFHSSDDGLTADDITGNLPAGPVQALLAVPAGGGATALLIATPTAIRRRTDFSPSGAWSAPAGGTGDIQSLTVDAATIFAARANGPSRVSTDAGLNWSPLGSQVNDAMDIIRVPGGALQSGIPGGSSGTTAPLWSASSASGAFYSASSGATWTAAPGAGDYSLPPGGGWTTVRPLGINAASGGREVLIGHGALGLYLTRDGGESWRNVSGAGSGLESTSRSVSALLSTLTAYGSTDLLVGITGAANGGVYLSGDGGEHWTQVNQGFDPSNLNITTLARSSCSGCPVQYYSGTYGSGVYTRTIPVNPKPAITGWCFTGAACACGGAAGSGPQQGGQAFKLCGGNFAALATVEFDGIPASGCTVTVPSTISCAATPAHAAGLVSVRVRNTDTRDGYISPDRYTYNAGIPRIANLRVAKSGANAVFNWSCGSCGTITAGVTRSQNALFNLNVESYIGGTTGSWTNTGALAVGTNSTYFWNVE